MDIRKRFLNLKTSLKSACVFLMLLFLWVSASNAQVNVVVLDFEDKVPVKHASILLQKTFGDEIEFTNDEGIGSLDTTGLKSNVITFTHRDHYDVVLTMRQLKEANYKVYMRPLFSQLPVFKATPSKRPETENEIVVSSRQIKRKQFEMQNPQTAAELLESAGSVFIQKSQMGGGSPMIRGFSANRVLLVVDGIRMNNAIFRDGNVHNVISLDPNFLQEVEVYEGPGSVIFGSDALGGVMHFKTLEVDTAISADNVYEGFTSLQTQTANRSTSWHVNFKVRSRKWSSLTGVSLSNYNSLRMGSRGSDSFQRTHFVEHIEGKDSMYKNDKPLLQEFSGYSQANISQKFLWRPGSSFHMIVGFFFATTSPVPRYDRLSQFNGENLHYAEWNYGPQKWLLSYMSANWDLDKFWADRAVLTAGYQKVEESRMTRDFGDTLRTTRRENLNLLTYNLDLDKKFGRRFTIFYGLDMVHNDLASSANQFHIVKFTEEDISTTRYPDSSSWNSKAVYATGKYALDSKWNITTGLRFNVVRVFAPIREGLNTTFDEIDRTFSGTNGSFGVNYHPDKRTKLTMNFATGFRAPNIDDIGKIFDSQPGKITVPNESLNPEVIYSVDFSFSRRPSHKSEFGLSVFYSIWDGPIQRSDYTIDGQDSLVYEGEKLAVQALVNGDQAELYGTHFYGLYRFSNSLKIRASYNWQQGQSSDNEPIRHIAPSFGQVHVIHTSEKLKVDLYTEFNGELSADELAPSERDKAFLYASDQNGNPYAPAWYTLNVKAVYTHSAKLNMSFGIENILDQHYRPYASGISAGGINAIFSLRTRF